MQKSDIQNFEWKNNFDKRKYSLYGIITEISTLITEKFIMITEMFIMITEKFILITEKFDFITESVTIFCENLFYKKFILKSWFYLINYK